MYLIYMDESGSPTRGHRVVGGLAIHEQDIERLANGVDQLMSAWLPPELHSAELHASPLRSGQRQWRRVPRTVRNSVIDGIANLLSRPDPEFAEPPVLFAVALNVDSVSRANSTEAVYGQFFARCEGFIRREANAGRSHRCLAISDETRICLQIQDLVRRMRSDDHQAMNLPRLESFVEVPLCIDSRMTRLVQLADFVAHWVYRSYVHNDASVLDRLLPAFDQQEGGAIHGLVHLSGDYRTCTCVACRSRR